MAYESKEPETDVEGKAPIIVIHGLLAAKNNLSSLANAMSRNRKASYFERTFKNVILMTALRTMDVNVLFVSII